MADERDETKKVGLTTMMGGGIVERFDDAWRQVLENAVDLDTDPKFTRGVNVKVRYKPNEDRDGGVLLCEVVPILAPAKKIASVLYVAAAGGRPIAREFNPKQMHLDEALKSGLQDGETVTLSAVPKVK